MKVVWLDDGDGDGDGDDDDDDDDDDDGSCMCWNAELERRRRAAVHHLDMAMVMGGPADLAHAFLAQIEPPLINNAALQPDRDEVRCL